MPAVRISSTNCLPFSSKPGTDEEAKVCEGIKIEKVEIKVYVKE